jgi:hypothetical protein
VNDSWEQLSLDEALTARDVAIARADDGAAPDWKTMAAAAVRHCADQLHTFTTDDVLVRLAELGAPRTTSLTALGPVMQRAAKSGLIVKTGELRLSRLAQRHRDLTVWTARHRGSTPAR